MKKIYLLTASLFLSLFVSAEETGKCGPHVTWTLSDDSVMTISGTGMMITDNFYYNKNVVKKVVIGNGITNIGNRAFKGCKYLAEIEMSATVKSIGEEAFYNCTELESIVIPNTVTNMEYGAFAYCSKLKNIVLSQNLKAIPKGCFRGCVIEKLIIPNSVTTIGENAFAHCEYLENIAFGNGVSVIGNEAFCGCYSLKELVLPANVKELGVSAFANSVVLEKLIILSDGIHNWSWVFSGCKSLTNVTSFCSILSPDLSFEQKVVLHIPYKYYYAYSSSSFNSYVSKYEFFYGVNTLPNAYGTIKVDTCYASSGETVKISVEPKPGYECTQLVLNSGKVAYKFPGQGKKKLAKSKGKAFILPDNEFQMPNYEVTVSGFFEPKK